MNVGHVEEISWWKDSVRQVFEHLWKMKRILVEKQQQQEEQKSNQLTLPKQMLERHRK
jgi:hypothetical protein